MIIQIRKQLSGKTNKLFMIFVICALGGIFTLPVILKQGAAVWALKVNDFPIRQEFLNLEIQNQQERLNMIRAQYGQYADMMYQMRGMSTDPKVLATDILIKRSLLNQQADAAGIIISPAFATEKLHNAEFAKTYLPDVVPPFLFDEKGRINNTILRTYLQRNNISSTVLTQQVEEALSRMLMVEMVAHSSYVPRFEKDAQVAAQQIKKQFSVLTFNYDTYLKQVQEKEPSQKELKEFFDEQNAQAQAYLIPEKRDAVIWKFNPKAYGITIAPNAVQEYYTTHKDKKYVAAPAQVTARVIQYNNDSSKTERPSIADLKDKARQEPELFARYAQSYSDDATSAKNGGLLAPLIRGKTEDAAIEKAAFMLQNPGDVSDVFATKNGLAMVQLVQKTPRAYKTLAQVQESIVHELQNQEFIERFNKDMQKIAKADGSLDEHAIQSMVKEYNATHQVVTNVGLDQNDKLAKALFGVAKEGATTFYTEKNGGSIVQVTRIAKKHYPALEKIQDKVVKDWYKNQAQNMLHIKLATAKNMLHNTPLAQVADKVQATLSSTPLFDHEDKKIIKELEAKGIAAAQMLHLERPGTIHLHVTDRNAYISQLNKIAPSDAKNDLDLAAFERDVQSAFIEGYIAYLQKSAKIKTNESLLMPIEDYVL